MAGSDAGPSKSGPNEFSDQVCSFILALRGFESLMGILRLGRDRRYLGYGLGIGNCLVPLSYFGEQMMSSRRMFSYQSFVPISPMKPSSGEPLKIIQLSVGHSMITLQKTQRNSLCKNRLRSYSSILIPERTISLLTEMKEIGGFAIILIRRWFSYIVKEQSDGVARRR